MKRSELGNIIREEIQKLHEENKYWLSPVGNKDDFGDTIKDEFIDGKTQYGPWALMTPKSWIQFGVGRFGTGYGQRYKKQPDNQRN